MRLRRVNSYCLSVLYISPSVCVNIAFLGGGGRTVPFVDVFFFFFGIHLSMCDEKRKKNDEEFEIAFG